MNRILVALATVLAVTLAAERSEAASVTEPVPLLQEFIRTQTVNPPGNESALTIPLFERFQEAGLASELTGAQKDRLNLIVKIPGRRDAKPIVLLAHVDTVLADEREWQVPPFAGKISDGAVWGRGALDDKGMAAALATALLRLHASGAKPEIPVTAIFAVDEETGSKLGVEWLLEKRPELFEAAYVINEGGFVILDKQGPAAKTYYVSVGEKGVAWLRLQATGTPGHGSIKWGDNANERLVAALAKLSEWKHAPSQAGPTEQFAMADLHKRGQRVRSSTEALQRHPIGRQIERDPKLRSSRSHTCNITMLKAGEKPNVIPSTSEAYVDCRLMPGSSPEDFLSQVRARINDEQVGVELTMSSAPNFSPWQTPLFAALERTAKRLDQKSLVVPVLAAGATDSRFFRERGIVAYGLVPIPVTEAMVQGMHGKNERVPVASLNEAADFLTLLIKDVAGYPHE